MARSGYEHASFMMLCVGDFSSKLSIPRKFMRKYGEAVQQSMILQTHTSQTSWDVKIKKMNSDFYMKDGWPEFVKDNDLDKLDFLTFRLVAESTFNVSIFRRDGCLQHPSSLTTSDVGIKRGRGRPRSTLKRKTRSIKRGIPIPHQGSRRSNLFPEEEEEGNPFYYEFSLKEHHRSRVSLKHGFAKAANMKVKKEVRMEYAGGGGYGVYVKVDPRAGCNRVDLTKGWHQFRQANGLHYGNTYSFHFNTINQVIYVKEQST